MDSETATIRCGACRHSVASHVCNQFLNINGVLFAPVIESMKDYNIASLNRCARIFSEGLDRELENYLEKW